MIVKGTLDLQGTSDNRIVFTSMRDDSPLAGGDTNGDGTQTAPSEGDWGYIKFPPGSNTSSFTNAVVRYGGRWQDNVGNDFNYMLWAQSAVDVRNCTVEHSFSRGIQLDVQEAEQPEIHQNDIEENQDYGLFNAGSSVVNAENNWWGAPSGPSHSTNSDGEGNAVSDAVAFEPFLKSSSGAEVTRPEGLTAQAEVGEVQLSWDENPESDIASYGVYRGTSPDPTSKIASVSDTTGYADTGVTNETTYYYRITAIDTDGNESDYSSNVRATPSAETLLGDVSGDGSVQAFDGALVLQHVSGITSRDVLPLAGSDSVSAEVSGNGEISSFDASYILRSAAGLISCFPASTSCDKSRLKERALATSENALSWGEVNVTEDAARLPLEIEGSRAIYGIDLSVSYDPSALSVQKLRAQLPDDWQVLRHQTESGSQIALAGSKALPSKTSLVFHFSRKESRPAAVRATGEVNEATASTLPEVQIGSRPESLALKANYPNPFERETTIVYTLPQSQRVTLEVYNAIGRRVAVLVDGRKGVGTHTVRWEAGDDLASGVYFYRLQADGKTETRRMTAIQ